MWLIVFGVFFVFFFILDVKLLVVYESPSLI